MITRLFTRAALHEHAEPAQRILGAAELSPESSELAHLLAADPAPEVRIAAAQRCTDVGALAAALQAETEPAVRDALAAALSSALAQATDSAGTNALLAAEHLADPIRVEVARRTQDPQRRHAAVAAIRDESALVDLALSAEHAEIRLAAAERVHTQDNLRKLVEAARNKDHGVFRLARQRLDAMKERREQTIEADSIIAQLESLATKAGPMLTEAVELNRRWQALDMSGDAERLSHYDAARAGVQARLDREHEESRARVRFETRLREWIGALDAPVTADTLGTLRSELGALRTEAQEYGISAAAADLDRAEERIGLLEQEQQALAGAEALVVEAEQLAAGTYIDQGTLPERWQALDRATRTPALTQRFETALIVVEQRRLAHAQAAQQEVSAVRSRIHALLHAAELALAAGQLRDARKSADEIKPLRAAAGTLPKPTMQRLGRLVQQLGELERWQSFGQHTARTQLCERAEALAATPTPDMKQLAQEVQKLRNEWKALDQQHAGVPKSLWERFDRACEKAYGPAARHFAEQAAQRKQARGQREEFIAMAAAHAPTLLEEPRDWRAIERWLRETEQKWREGELGSIEPRLWKKLDGELKAALAPARDALSAAREQAKAGRRELIAEATALATHAMERDAPTRVKAIQARWQEQAKALTLTQRDERELWEQFRTACDAVFNARQSKRMEEDSRKQEQRRPLEDICVRLDELARATDKDEQSVRRVLRELQDQWKKLSGRPDPSLRSLESRFRNSKTVVETALSSRARSREAAVWETLAAKEQLCEKLDARVQTGLVQTDAEAVSAEVAEQWSALPPLAPAWEQKMIGRRDAALHALAEAAAGAAHVTKIEKNAQARRDILLEIELSLGLDSPAEFQAQRLALQVKQLRDRFQRSAASASTDNDTARLLNWCAMPGIAEASDRRRAERIITTLKNKR
jgi:hypothetical protein